MNAQRGGILSLLLTLLALGAVLYFLLGGDNKPGSPASATAPVQCEQQIAKLMQATGGVGDAYSEGYRALPPSCQALIPAPGALAPSAERAPDT